jgi:adenylate cyclase class 2
MKAGKRFRLLLWSSMGGWPPLGYLCQAPPGRLLNQSSSQPSQPVQPSLYWRRMPPNREVEIKFRIADIQALTASLHKGGFRLLTSRTHEMNTLYDQPGAKLRRRGALLRLREYGPKWTLTYKDKAGPRTGRHKSRREIETVVENGPAMAQIIEELGFQPSFRYEKYRTEWSDANSHVVIDETPIGNFGEIEGPPKWIDATARLLQISVDQYLKESYAELFDAWKRRTKSKATEMTFKGIKA